MLINQLLLNPRLISPSHLPLFREVVGRYPYFTLARYSLLLAVERGYERGVLDARELDRARALACSVLPFKPFPSLLDPLHQNLRQQSAGQQGLRREGSEQQSPEGANHQQQSSWQQNQGWENTEKDLIDEFLENPEPWSPPEIHEQQQYQRDLSLDSATISDETISETLAQIYAAQGLRQQAADIYYKLSLKYPEKSIYFATLIDSLNRQ